MPTFNLGRFNRWTERLFNTKGGQSVVSVNPEVQVSLSSQPGIEERYLNGWDSFVASYAVTAVAAQFSRAMLRNPPGSNVVAVVESIYFNTTGTNIDYGPTIGLANLGTVQGAILNQLDARGRQGSTCIVSFDTNASNGAPANFAFIRRANVGPNEVIQNQNQEIPILPNGALLMISEVVNVSFQINIKWRERALELSELT